PFFFFSNHPAPTEIYTLSHTTLFRSRVVVRPRARRFAVDDDDQQQQHDQPAGRAYRAGPGSGVLVVRAPDAAGRRVIRSADFARSEEHTSELQSRGHLVCRLLLEKKK